MAESIAEAEKEEELRKQGKGLTISAQIKKLEEESKIQKPTFD
jgi:hypothetical protein